MAQTPLSDAPDSTAACAAACTATAQQQRTAGGVSTDAAAADLAVAAAQQHTDQPEGWASGELVPLERGGSLASSLIINGAWHAGWQAGDDGSVKEGRQGKGGCVCLVPSCMQDPQVLPSSCSCGYVWGRCWFLHPTTTPPRTPELEHATDSSRGVSHLVWPSTDQLPPGLCQRCAAAVA
jgi:hypothetical protein